MAFNITYAGSAISGVEMWSEDIPSRVSPEVFPRRHGSILQEVVFLGPRTVRVGGTITGSNETALVDYLNGIGRRTTEAGRAQLVLRDDNRFLRALKAGYSYSFQNHMAPDVLCKFTLDFVADDPFWYAATEAVSSVSIAASTTTFSVVNTGTAKTPPRIEFQAVANSRQHVKLTNTTIGLFIESSSTIASGTILTTNHDAYTVTLGTSNAIGDFSGSFFLLEPGNNNFEYTGPTSISARIYWTPRYV